MPEWDQDRLISASELERWCYCPLSWKLEREDPDHQDSSLSAGIKKHEEIGKEARAVMQFQGRQKDSISLTWVYLLFSMLLLMMGVSLVVLTEVGSLRIDIWRIAIVIVSILLLITSLSIYFLTGSSKRSGQVIKAVFRDVNGRGLEGRATPILFYLYGLFLLINGIVLLRPFGIDDRIISSIMAVSLLLLYIFLLVSVTINFKKDRSEKDSNDVPFGGVLIMGLVVSLSVLFIFISDRIDKDGLFGWVFLTLALVWFISALIYDWFFRMRKKRSKKEIGNEKESGLQIASLALMASVFTASTFLAKGDNLHEYYIMSIAVAAMWLFGAVFFFWRGSTHRRTAEQTKKKLNLPASSKMIQADDLDKDRGDPLVSKKHFLIGLPDMIIEEEGIMVPVEVKTGRIPLKPYFSHIMQLGAYMVLTDYKFGQITTHGYIEYAPSKDNRKRFKIEWDMMTKALVLSKVSEIREAERTKVAHRNHNREGKCRNCSRRDSCPERLA